MATRLLPILTSLCVLVPIVACERNAASRDPESSATPSSPTPSASRDDEHVMAYGDRSIYVYADPELDVEVARLFSLFEDLAREKVPLDGSTRLPIGWTTLRFSVEGEHGERLIVEEPDYDNQPETRSRRDISVSLATLARQRAVLEHAGVAGEPIDFDQHVLTIRGSLDIDEVFLLRVESPGGRLTGWRLSPTDGIAEDAELESLPVHVILAQRPALLDAMLLPPGYMVFYSGDTLTTIVNERDEVVWDATLESAPLERRPERTGPEPLLEPLD